MNVPKTEQLLAQILDELPDAVSFVRAVYDLNNTSEKSLPVNFSFAYANDKAIQLSGIPKDSIIGETILHDNHAITGTKKELFKQFLEVYETGIPHEFSYYHPGLKQTIDVFRTKFKDGVLNISRDRKAQQKVELELQQKNEELENSLSELQRSNENLEQYAFVASHDLQEPLRKILTYSDMLNRRFSPLLGEDGKVLIDKMNEAGRRMDQLIKDLLNYSKISVKQDAYSIVDLNDVMNDVLSDLETLIKQEQANIIFNDLLPVLASKSQMRQLFQNLLINALKFSTPNVLPVVQISSRIVKGIDSGIQVSEEDENITFQLLSFKDNGIGFPQSDADRIFQIFQRLHGRKYPGTGVGLSIVKKVIENHHGYITARGEKGKGATFLVLIPLKD